jgi:hypothetical protein
MTDLKWMPIPGTPMEIAGWHQDGLWHYVGRWTATQETWGGGCDENRDAAIAGVLALIDFTIAVADIATDKPLRDRPLKPETASRIARGLKQLNLF